MKRTLLVILGIAMVMWQFAASAPTAHADYFNYPCQPPGVGTGVDIHILIDAAGQFCDGPTEINLSHLHCESGGGGISGGAIGLAPIGGLSVGGFGGSGFGGGGSGCSWRCPDNSLAPAPNPPGIGAREYIDVRTVIKLNKAFCVKEGHLAAAGPTSELVSPDEGFPPNKDPEPYQVGDPNVLVPHGPLKPTKMPENNKEPEGNIPIPEVPLPQVPNLPVPVIPPILPLPGQG